MSTTSLKLTALIFMLIDHIGLFIPSAPIFFRYIGRLSAPIFVFCTVVGFNYSNHKKEYLLRLYLLSVTMGFIVLFIDYPFGQEYMEVTATFPTTLFIICVLIYLFYYFPKERRKKVISVFFIWQVFTILAIFLLGYFTNISEKFLCYTLPSMLGSVFNSEGGLVFVFLGLLINSARKDKIKLSIYFIAFTLVYFLIDAFKIIPLIISLFNRKGLYCVGDTITFISMFILGLNPMIYIERSNSFNLFDNYQWLMIFSLPFMLTFNQKKGKNLKYFFYVFYPAHIIILYFIGNYIYNNF